MRDQVGNRTHNIPFAISNRQNMIPFHYLDKISARARLFVRFNTQEVRTTNDSGIGTSRWATILRGELQTLCGPLSTGITLCLQSRAVLLYNNIFRIWPRRMDLNHRPLAAVNYADLNEYSTTCY